MKALFIICILSSFLILFPGRNCYGQVDTTKTASSKLFYITTFDGAEFYGYIISQDSKEVVLETKDRGQVSIPKYQVKEMKEIKEGELTAKGVYIPPETFSTRYFITTNGLSLEERESYILWNLWGPDFEFAVAKNTSVGLMTTWIGFPIVGSVKHSMRLGPKANMAIGGLLGWGTYIEPTFGMGVPYLALTFGDRKSNITFSGGYGFVTLDGDGNGRLLLSVAGMAKVGNKVSVVFDSFIMPGINDLQGFSLLVPGIRLQTGKDKTFQFGFGMIYADGQIQPIPVPFVQLFRKL